MVNAELPFISPKNVLAPLNDCVVLLTTPVVPLAANAIEITGVVVPVATVKPFGLVGLILTLVTVPFPFPVPAPIAVLKLAASKALTVLSALNRGNVMAEGLVNVNIDCPIVVPPKLDLAAEADVAPVPPFNIGKVPVTCEVNETFESVPPKVKLPLLVTVPVNVMPFIVPVPPTLVTVPVGIV